MNITKYPLKVLLYKQGEMIYFSQLDIFHLLERALRRSGLPIYYSQGFSRHAKISFKRALKLGVEGEIETTFYFLRVVSSEELELKLKPQLPEGLRII